MTIRTVRLPDVGEGIAEAELVSWSVAVGDAVTPETVIAEVLTDKATVEIYAPVAGTVAFVRGNPGDILAIGSDFIGIELDGTTDEPPSATPTPTQSSPPAASASSVPADSAATSDLSTSPVPTSPGSHPLPPEPTEPAEPTTTDHGQRPTAAPAVRERARVLGIDLSELDTAADGRIGHGDLDRHLLGATPGSPTRHTRVSSGNAQREIPLIGLRRRIASNLTTAWRTPHITYVDEIDMTQLEHLRASLSTEYPTRPRVTVLPFVMRAIVIAVAAQPHLNSTLDDEAQPNILTNHTSVHIGIATQTPNGLIVPVVRDAQRLDLWQAAVELARVTTAARDGSMGHEESTGSTITITSLGALGGLVTTPLINHPEVAIVGINKMQTRPSWDGNAFVPRKMMNMSSSFDHRVIDGWDAATFIQRIKSLLEEPALLFL